MSEGSVASAPVSSTPSAPPTTISGPSQSANSAGISGESSANSAKNLGNPGETSPKASAPQTYDVKVDGKIIKMSLEEALQYASAGHASDKRFKEAAQMRKQAESLIGRFRDPNQVIEALMDPALGLSKDEVIKRFEDWYHKEVIEPEKLSPEETRARKLEARLQKYEQDEKDREQQKIQAQQEAMTAQAREQVQKQIIEALENSSLPKTNFTIRRIAYWMQRNHANGYNAPTEVIVNQVRNEMNTSLRDMVENSDGEVLVKLLGENLITKLRKYDLQYLRKKRDALTNPVSVETESTPKPKERITSADVARRMREIQRTGRY